MVAVIKALPGIVIGILLVVSIGAITTCTNYSNKIELVKASSATELSDMKLEYEQAYREMERLDNEQRIKSENEWRAREQIIFNDVADARTAVNSMSDAIEAVTNKATTDAAFCVQSTRTAGDLLKSCTTEYTRLAENTDRLDSELRRLRSATGQ